MSGPVHGRPALVLRDARDGDMAAIQAIYAHHVRTGLASFEETPPDVEEMHRRRADILARGLPYVVVECSGQIGGYAYAGPYRTRSAYRFSVEDSVYVAPGLAGKGIGKLALAEIIERCTAAGLRQMVAVIGDSANTASIVLHERLGFRQTGVLTAVGFKFGRWVDSVLMQRALGPGDENLPTERAIAL
ncbi:MAG TPA: GNAT family N-acetyltransferase [Verrucomicrobiae bacterium]|jgi:L-amino acid N-acyltransferase YncA|nr:GNAT family N-acetyltransferase [Verrucomicrobiae bacterium]